MRESLSIWFFAGILFLIYGVIITGEGVHELIHPPAHPPVLFHLHPSLWWGAMMAVVGMLYTWRFRPRSR